MVVKDAEIRRKIADYYRMAPAPNPDELPQPRRRIYREANEFAQRLHEVPVFIIPCIVHDGSVPSNPAFGRGSFIFPAVQNILLAARGLGLGSILTGRHTMFDKEVKEILGIPDNVDTAALLPIGYVADGHGYGPTRRRALEEVVFTDRWGNNWGG
ncbi:MAG: nitroreductase family protein [Dehalococcoidia bacterium]|nr:nitroreductase family protein [Dehalococcoidia bacterium]